jgi:hypothetical protein
MTYLPDRLPFLLVWVTLTAACDGYSPPCSLVSDTPALTTVAPNLELAAVADPSFVSGPDGGVAVT